MMYGNGMNKTGEQTMSDESWKLPQPRQGVCPCCQSKVNIDFDKKGAYCLPHFVGKTNFYCNGSFDTGPQCIIPAQKTAVVYNNHTLGLLTPKECNGDVVYSLEILAASVIKGATFNSIDGSISVNIEHCRKATIQDFDDFRVSSKGHLN
jgi:hypothetical protein